VAPDRSVFWHARVLSGAVSTEQQVALELIRQLEVVSIRDPTLADYVMYVESFIWLPNEPWKCSNLYPN
jgi:hypothetical protein